jgi:hypothetical protein
MAEGTRSDQWTDVTNEASSPFPETEQLSLAKLVQLADRMFCSWQDFVSTSDAYNKPDTDNTIKQWVRIQKIVEPIQDTGWRPALARLCLEQIAKLGDRYGPNALVPRNTHDPTLPPYADEYVPTIHPQEMRRLIAFVGVIVPCNNLDNLLKYAAKQTEGKGDDSVAKLAAKILEQFELRDPGISSR